MVLCAELFGSCNFIELLGGETGLRYYVAVGFGEAIEEMIVVAYAYNVADLVEVEIGIYRVGE